MKNRTITITKSLIVSIVVIIIILLLPIFVRQSRSELEKIIISCESTYSECWKLSSVTQIDSEKKIIIYFRYSGGDLQSEMETIQKSFDTISNVLLKQSDSKYKDYSISYSFEHVQSKLMLLSVDKNLDKIQLHTDMQIPLRSLASFFPQVRSLYLYPAYYDDIDEIKNFQSLKKVYFSQGVSDEDKEAIRSAFPGCEINI